MYPYPFVNWSEFAMQLEQYTDWNFLDPELLDQPVGQLWGDDPEIMNSYDFKYWKPRNIGESLFYGWD